MNIYIIFLEKSLNFIKKFSYTFGGKIFYN